MPPKRKIEANEPSSPTLTPPPKRRSIVDTMDSRRRRMPNFLKSNVWKSVLWTERRVQEFMLVYFAPVDEPASIDDILSLTRDAPYKKKINNMSSIYCYAVYGAPDDPNPFTTGRIGHCKRVTGHNLFNSCGYSCNSNITQWTFDISDN
ncbi:hypothetical protein AC1031_008698 [Aphanomyces cochlioides]|nr:hypothetical protein AC1031_008698 [Aphanomyces cochlioides]